MKRGNITIRVTQNVLDAVQREGDHQKQITLSNIINRTNANNTKQYWLVIEHNCRTYVLSLGDTASVFRQHCNQQSTEILADFDALYKLLAEEPDVVQSVKFILFDNMPTTE